MAIREEIVHALHSGLRSDPTRTAPVDKLGAFAMASRLGTLLWRFAFNHDHHAYKPLVLILASKLPRHYGLTYRMTIAQQSLLEWTMDFCRDCGGMKEIVDEEKNLRIICPTCNGLGKHRYRDDERVDAFGRKLGRGAQTHLTELQRVLSEHDVRTVWTVNEQLERVR